RPLEEVVDDLDLLGPGPEARERVDEPLQPVVVLDDLVRRSLAQRVRLVVDHQGPAVTQIEDVDEAVPERAVVREGEVAFLLDALEGCYAAGEVGLAVRGDKAANQFVL